MPRLREVPLRDDGGPGSPRGVRGISFLRRVFPYELMLVLTLVAVAVVALRSEAAPLRRLLTSPMRAVMQRSSRQYSSGASGSGGLSALVERLENSMSLTRNDLDGADEYTGGTSASDERNTKQELLKKRLDRLSELLAAAVTEDSVDNTGGSATRPGQPRQAALGGAAAEVVARLRARLELQQQQRAQQATSGSAGQQAQQHPLSALTCPPAAACPACTEAASSPAACPRCPESPPAAACEDEYLDDATDSEQGFPFESAIVSGGDEGGPAGQSSAKRQGRRRRRRRRGSPTTPELLGLKNSNSGPAPGTSPGSGGAADDGYEEEDDLAASERLELLEEATARSPCPSAAPPPRVVVVVSVAPAPSCDSTRAIVLARECPACSTCPAVEEPRACSAAPECPTRSARPSPKSCPPAHPKEILPFPPMARGKVVFLSYGDDNFKRSLDRITDEARSFGVFDKVLAYTPSHFSKAYAEKNAELLAMPRGGGYWAWKSYFIWKTMQSLDYGDILFYNDAGSTFRNDPTPYIDLAAKYGGLTFRIGYKAGPWTKGVVFHALGMSMEVYGPQPMIAAGTILLQKRPHTVKLAGEFMRLSQNISLITDLDTSRAIPNHKQFTDHRHDQSIWTLLCYKYGFQLVLQGGAFPEDGAIVSHTRVHG